MLLRILASFALLAAFPANAKADVTSAIDRIIDSSGLASLEGSQRVAARALVTNLLSRSVESKSLSDSAEKFMRKRGYEPVYLSVVQVDGKSYLIAKVGFSSYATSNLPFLMSSNFFTSGEYFAKSNLAGGISEFIDEDGTTQDFMFSKWFRLK